MGAADVRLKILDAAERLFAERGYHGASMRQISEAAETSLSLVQYHFGAKEALLGAVFERRIAGINQERLSRLDKAEQATRSRSHPNLEDVLRAFLEPAVLLAGDRKQGGAYYAQLMGQLLNDPQPHARKIAREHTDPIARQTMRVLSLALPEISSDALAWCYVFSVGAMVSAASPTGRVKLLSSGKAKPDEVGRIIELLVPFIAGGLRAVSAVESQTK